MPPPPSPLETGPRPAVLRALRQLLRPLVRFLLDHQVPFPALSRLLKEVYVEVADRDFPIEGRPQTTTRVSLLTGIHRKDVRRLRQERAADDPASRTAGTAPRRAAPLGAQIVVRWTGEVAFLDAEGEPRALPRHGEDSFETLVASVSTDIRPRAVLDEWLRLGIARVDADDRVHLVTRAFVPERGFDEKAFFFGRNTRDHLAAAAHNLRGDQPALPDRSVYYGALSEASTDELRALAEKAGMEALRSVNRRANALQKRDAKTGDAKRRMTLGFYFYSGEEREDDDENGEGA